MAHSPNSASAIPFATHTEQLIQPKVSMTKPPAVDLPQGNRKYENSPLLYSDATYNVHDFVSQKGNESLDKSYGDSSPNEICGFKLDEEKIDELANDYRVETCVSSSRESLIQKESCKKTVKSDGFSLKGGSGTLSRNEDESRCKSNRKRKTRRKMPEGIIIDFNNDVYGISRGGIKISVISTHDLMSEMKFVAIPKKRARYSMRNSSPRNKMMKKMINNSILTVLCAENCNKVKKTQRSKRKCKIYSKESMNNILHRNATLNASKQLENILNEGRELHVENNTQSFYMPNEILDSTECCHHDDTLNIDNAHPILNTEQTCVDARKHIANYCSIVNDKHQEYHICDCKDYSADSSDFNAEMQTDWTAECFHPEYTSAKGCRYFYDSNEYDSDINMQHDRCPLMSRMARLFENSTFPKKHQREEIERLESDEFRMNIAPEFATEADEYSPDGIERCMDCDGKNRSLTSTIRKRVASKASVFVEPGGSVADLRDSRPADMSRYEIDTRPGKRGWRTMTTMVERADNRLYKSDLLKCADTWDARMWRDDCIGRRCTSRVVAEPSATYQDPGEKGESARGVDSEWKRGSIETDAQQLDYKWKRRIATVDAGTRATIDFKEKRDSRYKPKEAIRVQLRESTKIRKRESLEMVEATSQTRSDNVIGDGKQGETRDYSLWTSLQMGKIWSQIRDTYKNIVKVAATNVGVVKDAPKLERSQRNPVEVVDAMFVKSSSSCASKICGETCHKNLMCSKSRKKTEARQECTIRDMGKYHEDATEAQMRKNSWAIAPPRRDMQKHAYQNVEKEEDKEPCVTYNEYEHDGYQDIPLQNETYSHDDDVHFQSSLSESFTCLGNSTYSRFRNRGGSDDNRDFTRSTVDKEKSVQRIYEEAKSIKHYQNSISKKCICYDRTQETRVHCTDRSSQHVACYKLPAITTDYQAIRADESQLTNISCLEDNSQVEMAAMSEQTRSYAETETCESIEDMMGAETERSFTSTIADATVSSTETDVPVHSSWNDPNEPTVSTSKWEASLVSPKKSGKTRPGSRLPFCAMKFWRKRSCIIGSKTITSVLKRSRKSIGRKEPSSTAATTYDSGVKITQIEPSTVQNAREGNKSRAYVNVQVQTPDAIITRILSEFLVSGEKKKRVLMSIILKLESDDDKREMGTQTSSNDLTSMGINMFGYPDKRPQGAITTTSKTVQCFVCDKQDCYEIRQSDNSISLEEALIAEYPETSELSDYLTEQKADIKIPP